MTNNTQTLRALDALESSDYAKAAGPLQDAFLMGFFGRSANYIRFSDLTQATEGAKAWELGMASGMKPAPIKPN